MKLKNITILVLCASLFWGSISLILGYWGFSQEILDTIYTIEESFAVISIILVKIIIIVGMGSFLLYRWYTQEHQYLSDIPFLFSIFFAVLVFGKLLDLLINLLYYQLTPDSILFLVKIRFFIIIINLLPILILSIEILLVYLSFSDRFSSLKKNDQLKDTRTKIILIILVVDTLVIVFAPSHSIIVAIYPVFIIPFFIIIVWIFFYAYRSKRLSEINPLIVGDGFLIFLLTTIFRAVGQNILVPEIASILSELCEIVAFIVIFLGLIRKVGYSEDKKNISYKERMIISE